MKELKASSEAASREGTTTINLVRAPSELGAELHISLGHLTGIAKMQIAVKQFLHFVTTSNVDANLKLFQLQTQMDALVEQAHSVVSISLGEATQAETQICHSGMQRLLAAMQNATRSSSSCGM